MEKIKSFRRGRVWLNVFVDQNGELALTIKKSFPDKEGKWKQTPFLRPKFRDLDNLVQVLMEFMEFQQETRTEGWQQ